MRVLIGHSHYRHFGGEDALFLDEVALLRSYGHSVSVFTVDNNKLERMNPLQAAENIIWSRTASEEFRSLLRRVAPEVVHFYNTSFGISPSVYSACADAGVPVVQSLLNFRRLCPAATLFRDGRVCEDCIRHPSLYPSIVHRCYQKSAIKTSILASSLLLNRWHPRLDAAVDVFVTATSFARAKMIEGGLPAEKIIVKPNSIFPDPGLRAYSNGYAFFAGRLTPEKGTETLLNAWGMLGGIPIRVAGDGPMLEWVRSQVLPEMDVLGHVSRQRVLEELNGAFVMVVPSIWYEVFPVVIVEAFARGVPVIASRLGTLQEAVEEGKTGLLFEPSDPVDLANKVRWAFAHRKEMDRMGEAARERYLERFSPEIEHSSLMRIFARATELNKSKSRP